MTAEVIESIQKSVLCWLATSSSDGQPNVSPKEIFTLHESNTILIANIMSPQTMKNLKDNKKVCVSFIDILVQKGFQIKGEAEVIDRKHADFDNVHNPLFELAGPDYPIVSIIKIKAESIKPIIAPRYILFSDTTELDQIKSARSLYNL